MNILIKSLSIILLLITNNVEAQDLNPDSNESKLFNNAIYGNVGVGSFIATATAFYERMFQRNIQKTIIASFVKAGYGTYQYWGGSSPYLSGNFGILTRVSKHHLEVCGEYRNLMVILYLEQA